eukprot:scaffold1635_cov124-Skeletonema_dohrnii-CCMP3373.AAC.7
MVASIEEQSEMRMRFDGCYYYPLWLFVAIDNLMLREGRSIKELLRFWTPVQNKAGFGLTLNPRVNRRANPLVSLVDTEEVAGASNSCEGREGWYYLMESCPLFYPPACSLMNANVMSIPWEVENFLVSECKR